MWVFADLVLTRPHLCHRRLHLKDSCFAFVLQPVTLAADRDDLSVMEQPIEQCGGEGRVAGEGLIPLTERQIRGQDDRATLVATGDDLEQLMSLLASER